MSALSSEDFSSATRHDFFQSAVIEGLIFGVYTTIVAFALHKIVFKRGIKYMLDPLMAVMMVMYSCAIVHITLRWMTAKRAFVDSESRGATLEVLMHIPDAWVATSHLCQGAIMFFADGIMVWRCWRLYSRSRYILALSVPLLLGELTFLICHVLYKLHHVAAVTNKAGALKCLIACYAFTLALTVVITLLIVYKIYQMGGARDYRNIISIIVESSALYAITIIIYLPFTVSTALLDTIPGVILALMPGIASTLVISRVSLGHGIENSFDEKAVADRDAGAGRASALVFHTVGAVTKDEEASIDMGTASLGRVTAQSSRDETMSVASRNHDSGGEKQIH